MGQQSYQAEPYAALSLPRGVSYRLFWFHKSKFIQVPLLVVLGQVIKELKFESNFLNTHIYIITLEKMKYCVAKWL